METGICHKCGVQIFNGIPQDRDIREFEAEMKTKGFELGYLHRTVGGFGHMSEEIPIEPICSKCSQIEYEIEAEKETNILMKKVIPMLKKVYVCPVRISGFEECHHTADKKNDMIKHIRESHSGHDLERLVRNYEEEN